jgi:glycosyltransferase involved in cell wall biosynthesis
LLYGVVMAIEKVFVITPSNLDTSPIKGATALANSLSEWVPVSFVTLKKGHVNFSLLNSNIEWIALGGYSSWLEKINILRLKIEKAGDKKSVATISSSLSADFVNSFCTNLAVTCSSVRGNLPVVYVNTFGILGNLIAYLHLKRLKKMTHVVSMTKMMSDQVENYIGKSSSVIGNFVDEKSLDGYVNNSCITGKYKIIFSGSLIYGKQPLLLIDVLSDMMKYGMDILLDILGEGELLERTKSRAEHLGIMNKVNFHGYVDEPYSFVASSDILVLPSLSEGVSRSALEALFLGVPCVLRDVDGNSELIQEGVNGALFKNDSDLFDSILRALELSRNRTSRSSLLPDNFRQQYATKQYLELLEYNI